MFVLLLLLLSLEKVDRFYRRRTLPFFHQAAAANEAQEREERANKWPYGVVIDTRNYRTICLVSCANKQFLSLSLSVCVP